MRGEEEEKEEDWRGRRRWARGDLGRIVIIIVITQKNEMTRSLSILASLSIYYLT